MIVALEWVSGRIPRGTHDWRKFIRPAELNDILTAHGFRALGQSGVSIKKLKFSNFSIKPEFKLSSRISGVYVGAAVRD
jgi:2-polyprenyl-3-methyl-5-hydroxy-6-metoxy-1,4-benzoquinol methylase